MAAASLLAAASLAAAATGCAGYESTSAPLRRDLAAGQVDGALNGLNAALGVDSAEATGALVGEDTPLVLLERAVLLQALGRHELSARDFQAADAHLEVLDLDKDEVGAVMKYLWSDSARVYKAAPYEKGLLNTMNMLNYLVRGDLSGARVETRRLQVVERYLKDHEEGAPLLALGAYLSGFTWERSGRPREAMRYYADAQERGGVPTLDAAIARLHARTGAWDPRLGDPPDATEGPPPPPRPTTEVLVVVGTGRIPYRRPERMPLGIAMAILTQPDCRHCITSGQRAQATMAMRRGLLTFLNYPVLQDVQAPVGSVAASVQAQPAPGGMGLDVSALALASFARSRGALILASFTRALTRAVAGTTTDLVVRSAAGNKGGELLGFLAGMAVEGAMVAADTPDTRSWVSVPGRFHVFRAAVPPGAVDVRIRLGGAGGGEVVRQVDVAPGGYAVVTHLTLR